MLRIKIVDAKFEEDSFKIYKAFFAAVHNKPNETEKDYINFLCTPILGSKFVKKNIVSK
jgi:hypothetical protein